MNSVIDLVATFSEKMNSDIDLFPAFSPMRRTEMGHCYPGITRVDFAFPQSKFTYFCRGVEWSNFG